MRAYFVLAIVLSYRIAPTVIYPKKWLIHRFGEKSSSTHYFEHIHALWQPFLEVYNKLNIIRFTKPVYEPIYAGQRHTFPGTIQRYILKDDASPAKVSIWLVWKDTEMPDEATRERDLKAFQAELADVPDWATAKISTKEGIYIHDDMNRGLMCSPTLKLLSMFNCSIQGVSSQGIIWLFADFDGLIIGSPFLRVYGGPLCQGQCI